MADLGTLVTIADKVFQLLQSPVLQDLRHWKSGLENLNKTVSSIKNMLMDVDMKPELTHGEQGWVEELKEVLYEADDLFDEVVTLAKLKELDDGNLKISTKVKNKVSRFFSSKNSIIVGYNTSKEVKSIQQKLEVIARDHGTYDFKVDPQTIKKRTEDTCSFLNDAHDNIIGRDDDVKAIVDMLLDPNVKEDVGFVAIVGVGGLGKTTLAQLVFNDKRVQSKFENKLWACVSDHDGKLDEKTILRNIIEASTKKKPDDVSTLESLQTKLREVIEKKNFLLILDDVWTEDPNKWNKLKRYLTIGGMGSKVVVTTRSEKTSEVVLGEAHHSNKFMLKGLSEDNSWRLFELLAFKRESDVANDPELIRIGKIIVQKCYNVPLAIKVIGTLLYGQTHRWESFIKNRLPEIETSKNPIMSILKLSYDNLEPSVKNCFRYCGLFPKDYKISKQELIGLWTAQGYIDDGEDTFLILLQRCFFHDVRKDQHGNVEFFKMHDLVHDLAQEVSGDEFVVNPVMNCPTKNLKKTIRHLFLDEGEWTKSYFSKLNIRTCYMQIEVDSNLVNTMVANWGRLRSLRLYVPDCEKLSESIGNLLHLRYLDLSWNQNLNTLPSSITKLYNLQSLLLNACLYLCEWPEGFHKLVNLRLLNIDGCPSLTCMPFGLKHLTALQDLPVFKVSSVTLSGKPSRMQLKDIKYLVNIRGRIEIDIGEDVASEEVDGIEEPGYLKHIENLEAVGIYFDSKQDDEHEIVVAKLQPHKTLKHFTLFEYQGAVIPRWGREVDEWATIFPNLVTIELKMCVRLCALPMLSTLKHLKSLTLFRLDNLEFMENSEIRNDSYLGSMVEPFFLSLEKLTLHSLKRLKGWWSGVGENNSTCPSWQLSFPRLSTLDIRRCPELTSFPPCPCLKSLSLMESNKSLRILGSVSSGNPDFKLEVEEIEIDSVSYLTTLPAGHLTNFKIVGDVEVKSLVEIEEVFKSCCSSLRSLEIACCLELVSLSGGLEYLTFLERLKLRSIPRLDVVGHDNNMVWRSLRHNLLYLELFSIDEMENLPEGMKHLTSLQQLEISQCTKLKGIPEWISCLSSLQSLTISGCLAIKSLPEEIQNMTSLQRLEIDSCPDLRDACQEPSGKDWPKIRHIPHIKLL